MKQVKITTTSDLINGGCKEEETRILFQSKKQTIQSTLLSKEPQQVFQETQQILHQLFELEPFEFELVEETDE